jgi:hypothetical protein
MADVNFGIKSLKLAPAMSDGTFPDFATNGILIPMIVIDSFTYDKEDDQTTDLQCEDFDDVFLTLPGQKGKRTLTVQTYDLDHDIMAYLTGETEVTTGTGEDQVTWRMEGVGFDLPSQGMQIITRAIDTYPAKRIEYAKLRVEVKEAGTLGKNGLPNLTLTCTKLANMNTLGVEVSGKRIVEL